MEEKERIEKPIINEAMLKRISNDVEKADEEGEMPVQDAAYLLAVIEVVRGYNDRLTAENASLRKSAVERVEGIELDGDMIVKLEEERQEKNRHEYYTDAQPWFNLPENKSRILKVKEGR